DHDGHERITFRRANHGERNAGVARGRLDDGLSGLQRAVLLRILDDGDGQAVLDRAERVEELALHVHRDVTGCDTLNTDDGSLADRPQNAVVDHGALLPSLRLLPQGTARYLLRPGRYDRSSSQHEAPRASMRHPASNRYA